MTPRLAVCIALASGCTLLQLEDVAERECTLARDCEPANAAAGIDPERDCLQYQCMQQRCKLAMLDADGDGAPEAGRCRSMRARLDCDDADRRRAPARDDESDFDGVDNDCDTRVDEGLFGPAHEADLSVLLDAPASVKSADEPRVAYATDGRGRPQVVLQRGGWTWTWQFADSELVPLSSTHAACSADRPCGPDLDTPRQSIAFAGDSELSAGVAYLACGAGRIQLESERHTLSCGCRAGACDCRCSPQQSACDSDTSDGRDVCWPRPSAPVVAAQQQREGALLLWSTDQQQSRRANACRAPVQLMAAHHAQPCAAAGPVELGPIEQSTAPALAAFDAGRAGAGYVVAYAGAGRRLRVCVLGDAGEPGCRAELDVPGAEDVERVALALSPGERLSIALSFVRAGKQLMFANLRYDIERMVLAPSGAPRVIGELAPGVHCTGGPSIAVAPDAADEYYALWTDDAGVHAVFLHDGPLPHLRTIELCAQDACVKSGWPALLARRDEQGRANLVYAFTTQAATRFIWGDLTWGEP